MVKKCLFRIRIKKCTHVKMWDNFSEVVHSSSKFLVTILSQNENKQKGLWHSHENNLHLNKILINVTSRR